MGIYCTPATALRKGDGLVHQVVRGWTDQPDMHKARTRLCSKLAVGGPLSG